jgi:DNA-binding transcriptional ArsR family regulator
MLEVMDKRQHEATTIMKALADDMRLTIVRRLSMEKGRSLRSCDIVEACASGCGNLSQPAMSHHFKKLVDAGIITIKKAGAENLYSLDHAYLRTFGINPNKL